MYLLTATNVLCQNWAFHLSKFTGSRKISVLLATIWVLCEQIQERLSEWIFYGQGWVLLELILFEWELTACMKTTSCLQVVYLLFFDLFRKLGLVSRPIWPDKILVANQNGNLISTMTAHLVTRHITLSLWSLGYFRTSIRSPEN